MSALHCTQTIFLMRAVRIYVPTRRGTQSTLGQFFFAFQMALAPCPFEIFKLKLIDIITIKPLRFEIASK